MTNNDLKTNKTITLPYCYRDENTESEVKLAGKGCNFPYLTYMYLQSISYSSESNYRKIYIHHKTEYQAEGLNILTIASMCRNIKISDKTAAKNLKLLKEHNFVSMETFEDTYGTYHKLYNLDDNITHIVELDFNDDLLVKVLKTLNNKQIQLLIHYKVGSIGKFYYHSSYATLSNKMGISRDTLSRHNKLLTELNLIEIKRVLLSNNSYGNIYRCLI